MPDMFIVDSGPANEEKHDFASSTEGNGSDDSNPHQQINCQVVQPPSDVDTSSSINGQNGFEHLDPNVVAKHGGETLAKHTDFYADKTITEVPEATDSLKDGAYHVVKDICIDETANALEKIFEADNGEKCNPFSYNPFAEDGSDMNSEGLEDSLHQNVSSDIGYQASGFQEEDPVKFSNNSFLFNPFDTDGYDIGQKTTHTELLDLHGLRSPSIIGSSVCGEHSNDFNEHCLNQNSKVIPESVAELGPEDNVSGLSSGMANTREMMSHENLATQHIQEDASNLHSSDHQKQCNDSLNENDQMVIGRKIPHDELLDLHGLRSRSINGSSVRAEHSNDANKLCLSQNSKVIPESVAEVGPEDKVSALSSGKANTREMMSHENLDAKNIQDIQEDASNLHSSDHQKQRNDGLNGNDQIIFWKGNMENEESRNGRSASNSMTSPTMLEESNETKANNVELKAESVVSCHFHSGDGALSETDQSKKNTDGLPLGQILNLQVLEEASIDDQTTSSARSSFMHQSQGDSNLSGPVSLSGRTLSVGIPYSGSISHRSDSSNTSTRSFAFPILQSEWNSSPVKMAKADRRHLRKHRGWRMRLMCCRF